MADTPNSGSVPVSEENVDTVPIQPNSGLRHDFIGNSAFYTTDFNIPHDNEVILPRDNDVIITEAMIENAEGRHHSSSLPASSSDPPVTSFTTTAQSRSSATVSAGQNNTVNFRDLLLNLQQVAGILNQRNTESADVAHDSHEVGKDVFGDSLDAIVHDNGPRDVSEETVDNSSESDIIAHMTQYFANEDKCGPKINDDLAFAVCMGFRTKVPKDKRKALLAMHNRPENCDALKTPRVNKAVWHSMSRTSRDSDVALQILQSNTCSVTYPLLTLIDKMNTAKKSNRPLFGADLTDCLKLAMDSFKLVQLLYTDITYRRREAIQPQLHQAYKELCSEDTPVTDFLFGDDLDKRIKDLTEAKTITQKLHQVPHRGGYQGRFSGPGRAQHRFSASRSPSSSRHQPYHQSQRGFRRPASHAPRNTAPFLGGKNNARQGTKTTSHSSRQSTK